MKFNVKDWKGKIHTDGFFVDQKGHLYLDFGKCILKCQPNKYEIILPKDGQNEKETKKDA